MSVPVSREGGGPTIDLYDALVGAEKAYKAASHNSACAHTEARHYADIAKQFDEALSDAAEALWAATDAFAMDERVADEELDQAAIREGAARGAAVARAKIDGDSSTAICYWTDAASLRHANPSWDEARIKLFMDSYNEAAKDSRHGE